VSVEVGPAWATELFNALYSAVDAHDHTSGKGVQVPTAGLNINADLAFGGFNATTLRSARLSSQSATLTGGTDVGCLYNVLGDAYWNDASGAAIQLTKNHALNVTQLYFPLKSVANGTTTIQASDAFLLYYVDVTSGTATINLPASSALTPGRAYFFTDIARNSETNSITLVRNGADTINGVAGNFVIQFNGTTCLITTDGAGKWYAQDEGASYLRSAGISYTGTFGLTGSTGLTLTATAGNITANAGGASGVLALQANGTGYAFVSANASGAGLGIGATAGTDPTITKGTGVPATTQPNGSLFLRTDGSSTSALYSRQGGNWQVIGAGFSAPITPTVRTISSNYTLDASGSDYCILADSSGGAFNLTLVAPAVRTWLVIDTKGTFGTGAVTLVRNGTEKINGVAASKVLSAPWGQYLITGNGTDWFVTGL